MGWQVCVLLPLQERAEEISPRIAFSHAAPTEAETVLQIGENHALNTGTGAGDGKGLLDRSVHFPDKADLSAAFPVASPVLCISLCSCCLGFFQSGMNRVFYLVINKKKLTLLWRSCLSCYRKCYIIG